MKRYILILLALAGVAVAQPTSLPTEPTSLREIVVAPNGGLKVTQPSTTLLSKQIQPVTTGDQGRGVIVFVPKTTICDVLFHPGSDDALGFVGDTRGSLVTNCVFPVKWTYQNGQSKALIGYTNPTASNQPGPIYKAADGYAATFYRCDFQGGNIRLVSGVWQFIGCKFVIGKLYGIESLDAKINLIDCDFVTIPQPPEFGSWYPTHGPCGVRVTALVNGQQASSPLASRLYFSNCRLDGVAADGPTLCRRIATDADRKAGRTAYGLPGSVPLTCYLKGPN